jgi:UDP-3-O-[3-hydroxymyristoyl] glucosamine N-acyltransferase
MRVTLAELARFLKGIVTPGDGQTVISGITSLERAQEGDLTFIVERKYVNQLASSEATAVLIDMDSAVDRPAIRVLDPYVAFATLLDHFFPTQHPQWQVDPRAILGDDVVFGERVNIGPYVVIGQGVQIGNDVTIYPGSYIGESCHIGHASVLYANVSIYPDVSLGEGVIIHSGAVIGADGFGFYPQADGSYRKIPQVGRVIIDDHVEIGANTCIDRATLGDTTIQTGTKLDNLIQVGHNTVIGSHTVLAGQVGLGGSSRVGSHVRMGGQVGIADHATIGDGAAIAGQSGISSTVEPGATVIGSPAVSSQAFKRTHFYTLRLGELFRQVKQLQQRLAQLESRENIA